MFDPLLLLHTYCFSSDPSLESQLHF